MAKEQVEDDLMLAAKDSRFRRYYRCASLQSENHPRPESLTYHKDSQGGPSKDTCPAVPEPRVW